MKPLFNKEEFIQEEWIPIGQDPTLWADNILRIFSAQFPELGSNVKNIEWIKVSEEKKAGLGILNCSIGNRDIGIILLVNDAKLAPLDLYYEDGKIIYFKDANELTTEGIRMSHIEETPLAGIPVGRLTPLVRLSDILKVGEDIEIFKKIKLPIFVGTLYDDVLLIKKGGDNYLIDSYSNIIEKRAPIKLTKKAFARLSKFISQHENTAYKFKDDFIISFKNKYAEIIAEPKTKIASKGFYQFGDKTFGIFKLANVKSLCLIADDGRYKIGDDFEFPFKVKKANEFPFDDLPEEKCEGFFIINDTAILAKIASIIKRKNDITYKAIINEKPYKVSFAEIKKPAFTDEFIYLPKETKWKTASDKPIEFKSTFPSQILTIKKFGDIYSFDFYDANKNYHFELPLERAMLLSIGIGINPKIASILLNEGDFPITLKLKGAKIKPIVRYENVFEKYANEIQKLFTPKIINSFKKIKEADEDIGTKLISLLFVKKENLHNYLALFEDFSHLKTKLSEMLLQSRVGELPIEPMVIKNCLDVLSNTLKVFQEVYTKIK
ncbi:MAG: hypothetical protein QXI58_00930 [Candidatus Micrarchaeia archaeon]